MKFKTFPILLAFLVMGIADAMGPLASAVQENYEISAVMATLLTFFVFMAFAIFSIPGGVLAGRICKKNLLLGLGLNIATMGWYGVFPVFFQPRYDALARPFDVHYHFKVVYEYE